MRNWESIGTAAFGGMAPNLLILATGLASGRVLNFFKNSEEPMLEASLGVLATLLYGLLGGAVGAIWKEEDLKKSFSLGLGLPSLLLSMNGSVEAGGVNNTVTEPTAASSIFQLVTPVFAQVNEPGAQRRLIIRASDHDLPTEVVFLSKDQNEIGAVNYHPERAIDVPPRAAEFQIRVGWNTTEPRPLEHEVTLVDVKKERSTWYSFLYALGFRSIVPEYWEIEQVLDGRELFWQSIQNGDLETLKLLLTAVDVNEKRPADTGDTPLVFAVKNKSPEVLELLLEHGANLGSEDRDGQTALGMASDIAEQENDRRLLEVFAEYGLKPESDLTRELRAEAQELRVTVAEHRAEVASIGPLRTQLAELRQQLERHQANPDANVRELITTLAERQRLIQGLRSRMAGKDQVIEQMQADRCKNCQSEPRHRGAILVWNGRDLEPLKISLDGTP